MHFCRWVYNMLPSHINWCEWKIITEEWSVLYTKKTAPSWPWHSSYHRQTETQKQSGTQGQKATGWERNRWKDEADVQPEKADQWQKNEKDKIPRNMWEPKAGRERRGRKGEIKGIILTSADFLAHQLPQHVSAAPSNTRSLFRQASLVVRMCVCLGMRVSARHVPLLHAGLWQSARLTTP